MTIRLREIPGRSRREVLAAIALGLLAAGCGSSDEDAPSQVWGQVVCRGKPLTEGAVILMPVSDKANTWGAGHLGRGGRFNIVSSRSDIALQPGRYAVYIRPPLVTDRTTLKVAPRPGYPVPAKYLDAEHPEIHVQIGTEPTKLDLTLDD
ncbi:hypothetical protein [Paludisphaera mucosa]|uniref:Carboxypeptidase regulatory-like domain-containing protein n=1 Tax=Paludisphaera mucosa TaxID=3030827 RepID=A0ABT6FDI4_9BACT|nr:hypothetical protein [Paludisphaera mucosa]MDG3005633.1 hypothetical protein [Paludisphaera mucosa]